MAADPLQPFSVLLVVRIGDRFEEFAIAPGSADILRRATSDSFDEAWVSDPWHRIGDALDADGVFPPVAEIVEIPERLAPDIPQDVGQPRLAGVERSVAEARVGHAPADIAGADLVEVAVGPAYWALTQHLCHEPPFRFW